MNVSTDEGLPGLQPVRSVDLLVNSSGGDRIHLLVNVLVDGRCHLLAVMSSYFRLSPITIIGVYQVSNEGVGDWMEFRSIQKPYNVYSNNVR